MHHFFGHLGDVAVAVVVVAMVAVTLYMSRKNCIANCIEPAATWTTKQQNLEFDRKIVEQMYFKITQICNSMTPSPVLISLMFLLGYQSPRSDLHFIQIKSNKNTEKKERVEW